MATTSTVITVKQALVTLIDAAVSVPVTYAWPGKLTQSECVFLGPHPETSDVRIDVDSQIPTMKAGRKQRAETYTVRVTVWVFRPDLTVEGAEECETRAFELFESIENVLADDPSLGSTDVQLASVERFSSTLFPFAGGWACGLGVDLAIEARLL
jgi:hypothetical protein